MLLMPRLLAQLAVQAPHVTVVVYAAPLWRNVLISSTTALSIFCRRYWQVEGVASATSVVEGEFAGPVPRKLRRFLSLTLDSYLARTSWMGVWERRGRVSAEELI